MKWLPLFLFLTACADKILPADTSPEYKACVDAAVRGLNRCYEITEMCGETNLCISHYNADVKECQ